MVKKFNNNNDNNTNGRMTERNNNNNEHSDYTSTKHPYLDDRPVYTASNTHGVLFDRKIVEDVLVVTKYKNRNQNDNNVKTSPTSTSTSCCENLHYHQVAWNTLKLYLPIVVVIILVTTISTVQYNSKFHNTDTIMPTSTTLVDHDHDLFFQEQELFHTNNNEWNFKRRILEDTIAEQTQLINKEIVNDSNTSNNSSNNSNSNNISIHKGLFPLSILDYYGILFACIGLMIAAGGGIGGGGILVPIYILVLQFPPRYAIPLSNVTIVGGAIANNIINIYKRHPLIDRPIIDWDLCVIMLPLTLVGALIGTFINKILSELLLSILLVLLLSITSYTTINKAIQMYKIETQIIVTQQQGQQKQQKQHKIDSSVQQNNSIVSETQKLLTSEEGTSSANTSSEQHDTDCTCNGKNTQNGYMSITNTQQQEQEHIEIPKEHNEIIQRILEQERYTPIFNVIILIVTLLIVLIINLLKGGGNSIYYHNPIQIQCGSIQYWIANSIILIWILCIAYYFRSVLLHKNTIKEQYNYPFVIGDIHWNTTTTLLYPTICCCAGFFAGMFGIGGGIITGPLMLAMNVHPEVNSATSACMILFTAITALTSFIVFGLVIPDYAILFFIIGFIATYIGHEGLSYIMKQSNRNSYIAFSIGIVVALSSILMSIQSFTAIINNNTHATTPRGICTSK